ncbi:MAG: NAD(P)H-dependent oxidoreductase subunit E [Actinomycetia bacterium]|nr:NAD(P)H-dependent oxidoreductase subunit E [Actinomycetes bacterium]
MTNGIGGNGKRPRGVALKDARGAEPKGSALYEVLKGVDFERRQLVGKSPGTGLFDLVAKEDGGYRCYSCTLCERTCPVDCIELEYCPEFPEEPFDFEAARAAALATLPGESCGAASACVMGEAPAQFVPEIDKKLLDPVIAGIRSGTGLVEALHATQEAYGYLPRVALEDIAEEMGIPFSRVFGVASFYSQFRLRPVGKYVIDVCMGTACHVAGAPLVVEAFSQELEIPIGGTTLDGLFTLQTVNCVGACALAPVVRIGNDETFGRMGPTEARRLVRRLRRQEVAS